LCVVQDMELKGQKWVIPAAVLQTFVGDPTYNLAYGAVMPMVG
jgi:hypothetical protein